MTERFKPAIIRVWDTDQKIVGVGVLVGSRQIITCAHVVRGALKLTTNPQQPPTQKIKIDFPFVAPNSFLSAQVRIWETRQAYGSGDIAGLEITDGFVPLVSRPVKLIITNAISELSGHSCCAYGFPERHDNGVWSYNNKIQDERSDGTVQVTNENVTGHRIQKGFSGGALWDEELNGVVGIITTSDNEADKKVAFMLPSKTIVEICPLLKPDNDNVATVEIPFIVLAMTKPQARELLDGKIFEDPEVTPSTGIRFNNHKNLLADDGINDLQQLYENSPEEWKPYEYGEIDIEQIIWQTLNHHNQEHRSPADPVLIPKFFTNDFFSNTESYQIAKKMFEKKGGVIVIDAISLHHPQIYKRLSGSGLLANDKVGVLILSPLSKNMRQSNNLVEEVIRSNMDYAFDRFAIKCDPSCEIAIGDARIFKRWFINTLHKISAENQGMQERNKILIEELSPHKRGIDRAWLQ